VSYRFWGQIIRTKVVFGRIMALEPFSRPAQIYCCIICELYPEIFQLWFTYNQKSIPVLPIPNLNPFRMRLQIRRNIPTPHSSKVSAPIFPSMWVFQDSTQQRAKLYKAPAGLVGNKANLFKDYFFKEIL
jgi:hypothetical protein